MNGSTRRVEGHLENCLLSCLPAADYRHLEPKLERVAFDLGHVLYEPGAHLDYLYFPTSCVVSLLYTMENGSTAEMGLTGNDGAVGIALFLGGQTMPTRAVVQIGGNAFRLKVATL